MGADQQIDLRGQIASTLDWWRDAGVDVLVDDAPRDWLAPPPAEPVSARPAAAALPEPAAPPLPESIEDYVAWRMGADAVERRWGGKPIAPEGDPAAPLHVVVDCPDDAGEFLHDATARLFDRMLAAIGLDRGGVCITGIAWAPPVTPLAGDDLSRLGAAALHFLSLARPKRVLLLGQTTSRAILATDDPRPAGILRGINHGQAELEVVASWHPRFLLDRPAFKAKAWADLQLLIRGVDL